ncbi:MAG: hypothetical protein BWY11_01896 [Firmicutes bacterium ADurb.Bin182]|nr:MAG: hypothetical protein BWY11_01896 [Firmicutes bacterium ADurb.Bin182]
MNSELRLIYPAAEHLSSYDEAVKEYEEHNIRTYNFSDSREYDIFDKFEQYRSGRDLPPNRVKASYFWLVEANGFIGEIVIRHSLNEALLKRGGNIGYGIRYSQWDRGYGTMILKMVLPEAKAIGLDKVLITCDDDNIGSSKVIEKNGGILENKIIADAYGTTILTRRYWIDLNPHVATLLVRPRIARQ